MIFARQLPVLLAALAVGGGAMVAASIPASGASSSTVVAANVLSATSLDASGCAANTAPTNLGSVMPGSSVVSAADCVVSFGSTNDSSSLRLSQRDGYGGAMFRASTGKLDLAFDGASGVSDGKVRTTVGANDDYVEGLAMQPDGKVIAVGTNVAAGPNIDVALARYNTDGTLDASFDGPGAPGDGKFTLAVGTGDDLGEEVAVLPDGKLLVVGTAQGASSADIMLLKLNPDGSYDQAFDGDSGVANGKVIVGGCGGVGNSDTGRRVAVLDDGKILVSGSGLPGATSDFALLRFNADGTLDQGFDGDTGVGNGIVCTNVAGASADYGFGLDVQADGKVVAVGNTSSGGSKWTVVRYLANGQLDTAFDGTSGTGNGIVLVDPGGSDYLYDVAVEADGHIVAAGFTAQATNDGALLRLAADGSLDTGWDGDAGTGNGVVIIPEGATNDYLTNVLVQDDGKVVAAGDFNNAGNYDQVVVRVGASGVLDTSFDGDSGVGDGRVSISFGTNSDGVSAFAAGPDGSLYIGGHTISATYKDFAVTHLIGNPIADWSPPTADFTTGSMFAACLQTAPGAAGSWSVAGAGNCVTGTPSAWHAIAAGSGDVGAEVATDTAGPTPASVTMRFGMRSALTLAPGSYTAPISFSIVAPNM